MEKDTNNNDENELEELVLRECLVSATGLNEESIQIGIKGDPSLRETSLERRKYESPVDKIMDKLIVQLEELLLNRSTYRIFIGFNSGEIHTYSIFDPLRYEVHVAEKIADRSYIDRHFPEISYEEKIQAMRDIYGVIQKSKWFERFPGYWKNIFIKRHESWEPMTREEIHTIMSTLKTMRDLIDISGSREYCEKEVSSLLKKADKALSSLKMKKAYQEELRLFLGSTIVKI